jgi:hypothetical protein
MKQIFICQHTGKKFDNEFACLESEYKYGGEHQKFVDLINTFFDEIEKRFKVKVKREEATIHDILEDYYGDRNIHRRRVRFDFAINGRVVEYYKGSDSVGDGRWEWDCKDELEDLVRDFEKTHLLKLRKKFEGKVTFRWDNRRGAIYFVGNQQINDIFAALSNNKFKNKKIRIEVLD